MLSIEIRQIRYPGGQKVLLRDLSFNAEPGALVLLSGSNGCGKTTLLNAISGVIPTHIKADIDSEIAFDGLPLREIPLPEKYHLLAYQMEDVDAQLFFPDGIKELSFALENMGLEPEDMEKRIVTSARRFGMEDLLRRDPSTLSKGQKKLLLLAVCDSLDAPLVLLDEPSAGLAGDSIRRLSEWINHLRRTKRAVIVADHDSSWLPQPYQTIALDGCLG